MSNSDDWKNLSSVEMLKKLQNFQMVRMKIGTYTGDAAATKAITGVGFQPTFLLIWETVTNKNFGFKSSSDGTKSFVQPNGGANLYVDDQIISLDAGGFTVGDGTGSANHLNEAQIYVYIAFG